MYFHALLATLQLREFKSEANDKAMKFLPAQFPLGVSMCAKKFFSTQMSEFVFSILLNTEKR